jgi:hypothetical protein
VAAAIEAAKYISKASDVAALGPSLVDLEHAIKGHRFIAASRPLGAYVGTPTLDGAEMTDADQIDRDNDTTSLWMAQWDDLERRYYWQT